MVDRNSTHYKSAMDELRATEGWKMLEQELLTKRVSCEKTLLTSETTEVYEIAKCRARYKLIGEIFSAVLKNEEER